MKRLTSLCIVLTLLIVVLSISPAFSAVEKNPTIEPLQESYDNDLNKLHFYFGLESSEDKTGSALARTVSNEVSVDDDYFTYIDTENELDSAIENMNSYCDKYVEDDELIQVTVEFKSEIENTPEFIAFHQEKENIKTIDELRDFRKRLANFSKEYHNEEVISYINELEGLEYDSIEIIDYSPFVRLSIKRNNLVTETLATMATNSKIANISFYVNDETINQATWNRTMREIEAYSTINNSTYTGEGIRVGVLETAVCEPSHSNLEDIKITIEPGYGNDTIDDSTDVARQDKEDRIAHANAVTSIIALMAPEVEIFASRNTNDGISWFVDMGCDVVNCSFSKYTKKQLTSNTYDYVDSEYRYYFDGLIDYQIKVHCISVVAAAGNAVTDNTKPSYNPQKQIRSPAIAHNVIAVGGLDCTLGLFDYNLEYNESSCYVTTTGDAKPEISALYEVTIPNIGSCSGTSFAAPQVTGTIALIMCKYVENALKPNAIKAMLISGANQVDNHSNMNNSFFDEKTGAGCVSLDNLRSSECIIYMGSNNSTSLINSFVYSYDLSLSKNDILQNSISWYAHIDYANYTGDASDFNIMVYNSSGNLVASSSLGNFNTSEFIRYKVPSSGTYTIKVYQNGSLAEGIENEPFAFVCNIL